MCKGIKSASKKQLKSKVTKLSCLKGGGGCSYVCNGCKDDGYEQERLDVNGGESLKILMLMDDGRGCVQDGEWLLGGRGE
jgi:hypothetical protein